MKMQWLACIGLTLLVGCNDPLLQEVASPRPRDSAPATRPAQPSWLSRPKAAAAEAEAAGDIYLLHLEKASAHSAAVTQSPYAQAVLLRNVEPAQAVYLMSWLTEPSGRGGSGDRRFLVYTDSAVQEWAARLAVMLDVPAGQDSGWAQAVRDLLGIVGPRPPEPSAAEKILARLEPLYSGQSDSQHRWPACMLAGRLLDEVLNRPREAAGRFELAASISLTTSPAWLIARYAQARALRSAGDRAASQVIAREIVDRAAASFQRTMPYRQARRMVQAK